MCLACKKNCGKVSFHTVVTRPFAPQLDMLTCNVQISGAVASIQILLVLLFRRRDYCFPRATRPTAPFFPTVSLFLPFSLKHSPTLYISHSHYLSAIPFILVVCLLHPEFPKVGKLVLYSEFTLEPLWFNS